MKASVGDQLMVRGTHLDDAGRDGEILEVHGAQGAPPYVVRWSDNGHETLFFPGPDATVHHFEHPTEPTYVVETVDLQQQPAAVVSGRVSHGGIADFLATAFGRVAKAVSEAGAEPAGPPFARYQVTEDGFEVQAGFPVRGPVGGELAVDAGELPGGRAARTLHAGSYAEVGKAYRALQDWVVDNGYVARGLPWETYLDGPDVPVPRTQVYLPYAEPNLPGSGDDPA